MHVRPIAGGWEVLAPAKLNLFLEVLARREDGFHEIETLMVPVGVFDRVRFQAAAGGEISLTCQWAAGLRKRPRPEGIVGLSGRTSKVDWEELPEGNDNVAMRAVELLRRRAGIRSGAALQLTKRIPLAAGLGGGSSDAAAALVAANLGWRLGWSQGRLQELAAEIGSDVPFFLGSGPAVCRGRGERIEPLSGLPSLHFVVVAPPAGLSTAAVYRACTPAERPRPVEPLIEAVRRGSLRRIGRAMHNQLQPPAQELSDWIDRALTELLAVGCVSVQMSGSGTSCCGICRHASHARRAARRLRVRGWRAMAVRSLPRMGAEDRTD